MEPTAAPAVTAPKSVDPAPTPQPPVVEPPAPQSAPSKLLDQVIDKTDVACDETGALLPRSLNQMWRLANGVYKAGLAPKAFKTAEQIVIAFAYGAELGVKPMQSLQFFAVVNGKVSIYGDAQLALAMPVLAYFREWYEDESGVIDQSAPGWAQRFQKAVTSKTLIAVCEAKRKDQSEPVRESFSMFDAVAAKLYGKEGPWSNYGPRMCKWRARGWTLRAVAADRFGGLISVEEARDIDDGEPTPQRSPALPGSLGDRLATKADALKPNGTPATVEAS